MIRQGHLGRTEAIIVAVAATAGKIFLSQPAVAAQHTATAAPLMVLVNGLLSMGLGWMLFSSLDPEREEGMVAQFERLAGPAGTLIGAVIAAYFFGIVALHTRQMGGAIITGILPNTPITVVEGATVLVFSYAAVLGLEAIARSAMVLLLPIVTVVFILLLLTLPRMDFTRFFPPLGFGWQSTLYWSAFSGWYREAWVVAVLFPYLRRRAEVVKIGVRAIAWSALVLTIVTSALLALFGYPTLTHFPAPAAEGSRAVYLGPFISNLESVFVFLFTTALFLTLSVMFWASCLLVADLLKLDEYRPLVPLLAVGAWLFGYLPGSLMETVHWVDEEVKQLTSFVLYPGIGLLWFLALRRRKKERRHAC
ncbi:MAG: GerAB/ArcD/ProY family transporter [Bacillota bacterium]|nr:GerAB/ArcD/ProY family transporter [Bacillota bacterium]